MSCDVKGRAATTVETRRRRVDQPQREQHHAVHARDGTHKPARNGHANGPSDASATSSAGPHLAHLNGA